MLIIIYKLHVSFLCTKKLEPGKDVFNDEDINSTDILPECEPENVDSETMQQCRFLSE